MRARLGEDWPGGFVVGHGMDADVLEDAGIGDADVLIAATDGDNTNAVVAQLARQRYGVGSVGGPDPRPGAGRVLSGRGFEVVSPARAAIDRLAEWALGSADSR